MKQIKILLLLNVVLLASSCSQKADEYETSDPWGINGRVAFTTNRGNDPFGIAIYDGGKIERISEDGTRPKWSPDGRRVLYLLGENYAILTLGSDTVQVEAPFNKIGHHAWMPDGNSILAVGSKYSPFKEGKPNNLYRYDFQEASWTQLTHYTNKEKFYSIEPFTDGKRVLCSFANDQSNRFDRGTYIYYLETGEMKKIMSKGSGHALLPGEKQFVAIAPVQDKHGETISPFNLFLVDVETGKEKHLLKSSSWKGDPTISPDGRFVLYSTTGGEEWRIMKYDLKTGKQSKVFPDGKGFRGFPVSDQNPDWTA